MDRDESAATSPNPSFLLPRSHSHFGSHPSLIAGKTTPLFFYTCVEPILQRFCFQIHACNAGLPPLLDIPAACPPPLVPYLSPAKPSAHHSLPILSPSFALFF